MNPTRVFALGLVAGCAMTGGAALALGGLPSHAPGTAVAEDARPERGEATSVPSLAVARVKPAVSDATLAIDLRSWIDEALPRLRQEEQVERRLWPTIAACWARLGRKDDVVRACEAGIAAGGNGGDCTWPLSQLAEPARYEVLAALRARHPDLVWDPILSALTDVALDRKDAAIAQALSLLRGRGPRWGEAFSVLSSLDPARALDAVGDPQTLGAGALTSVSKGLAATGRKDLADAWAQRARERAELETRERRDRELASAREKLAADPTDQEAWAQLAQLLEQTGDTRGALDAWKRLAEIEPLSEDALANLFRLDPAGTLPILEANAPLYDQEELWTLLARAYLFARRGDDAVEALLHVRADELESWWDDTEIAAVSPQRAAAWLTVRMRSPSFAQSSTYVRAHARVLAALGRRADAYEVLTKAADLLRSDGWVDRASIDPRRAAPELESYLKTVSKDVYLECILADAWGRIGERRDEALAIWRAYQPSSNGPETWAALASLGDGPALARLEAAAKEGGSNVRRDTWWKLASVYTRLGRGADAQDARDHAFVPGFHTDSPTWLVRWCLGK